MKRYFALFLAALLLALPGARAQGPDDQYIRIYNVIQEADALNTDATLSQALTRYREAQASLEKFQRGFPDWNPTVVRFRLEYIAGKIAALAAKLPTPPPAAPGTNTVHFEPQLSKLELQFKELQAQMRQLEADKALLEAKLREALSVQPATTDPRELAKAEEKIQSLQKENDLLKVSVEQEKAKAAPPAEDPKALAEAKQQLTQQKELAARLASEKQVLQSQVKNLSAEGEAVTALRAENAMLKKQLAGTKDGSPGTNDAGALAQELSKAQTQVAALQSERDILRLEKVALESRVKQLNATAASNNIVIAPFNPKEEARVKELERERDTLRKKLAEANKDLADRKKRKPAARIAELEREVATLQARLDTLEAKPVPFTAEELALFSKPGTQLPEGEPQASGAAAPQMSATTTALATDARRYFSSGQLDKAEATFVQVVQQSQTNVAMLANLATVQMERNRLPEAEATIRQALALAPDDAASLSILGYVKFREKKYDEALDVLSRAAKLDPKNPQVENFLGITLSEKGLRGPAETAFRKAIEIEPRYGDAHVNLAVIYLSQQPPATELARWHYQKALAAGHARSEYVEKMLEGKK